MRDGEWRLDHPGASLTFGPADADIVFLAAPDLGDTDLQTDDSTRPRADGVAMGVDLRGGRTIGFDLAVIGASESAVRASAGALGKAWRADEVRLSPGEVATLTACHAGRERVVYGRPRRFAHNDEEVMDGVVTVVCDFAAVDDLFYGTDEHVETVNLVPPPSGGMVTPLATPLTTTPPSSRSTGITVGGELGAWPVITIHGPITNPAVQVTGLWTMNLATILQYDEAVTIDTRPWRRRITRTDGASLAGSLTRPSVRLARAAVPPGTYEVALRGIDATGTSSMRFAWRETYTAL